MPPMTCRLWLWSAPLPDAVAADFQGRAVPLLKANISTEALLALAEDSERLLVGEAERLAEVLAAALDLPPEAAQAFDLKPGMGAALVLGPRGWELERFGSPNAGPHLGSRP